MRFSKSKLFDFIVRYFSFLPWIYSYIKVLWAFINGRQIVLIYSIGKVGSTTIYDLIRDNQKCKVNVFHVHSINRKRNREQKIIYKKSYRKSVPPHLYVGEAIGFFSNIFFNKEFIVFTPFRDPISRELSSVFQDLDALVSSDSDYRSKVTQVVNEKIQSLSDRLPEYEWIEREVNDFMKVDILNHEFDYKLLYSKYDSTKGLIYVCRLEDFKRSLPLIFIDAFGVEISDISSANSSTSKDYYHLYNEEKERIRMSLSDLSSILNQTFYSYIYSDKIREIESFWKK